MSDILYLGYFGSFIRGDDDDNSDIDVLCVLRTGGKINEVNVSRFIDPKLVGTKHVDLSVYGELRFKQMWDEGHLFAWHIYLESLPLGGYENFKGSMGKPGVYANSAVDIRRLIQMLMDVRDSITKEVVSKVYEAGLIYVAARNIGISASWYSDAGLNFSRLAPYSFSQDSKVVSFPVEPDLYSKLCASRHAAMRGGEAPIISLLELRVVCDKVLRWSELVLNKVEALS